MEILYESENYVIVNKQYDMYINSDDPAETNTVAAKIAKPDSHLSTSSHQIHFVHRLDYATSGVLCLAKNKMAAAKAGKMLEKRLARKYYLAVVRGHLDDCCDISYGVGEDPATSETNHKMLAVTDEAVKSVSKHTRAAHTRLLPLEHGTYDDEDVTVVLLKPTTGRRHQLRVHCRSVGHPILGDYTYSDGLDTAPHRMFLHAARLVLPMADEPIDVQTSTPFTKDDVFRDKYKEIQVYHNHSTSEDFANSCKYIDEIQNEDVKKYTFCD